MVKYNPQYLSFVCNYNKTSRAFASVYMLRVSGHYDGQWSQFIYLRYGNQVAEYQN